MSRHLFSTVLVLLLLPAGDLLAQGDDVKTKVGPAVDEMVVSAKAVRQLGRRARIALRTQANKLAPEVMPIVDEIREQMRSMDALEADDEDIEKSSVTFVRAAKALLALGIDAAPAIEEKAGTIADAADKALVNRAAETFYRNLAKTEFAKYATKGTFLGMYSHLKVHGPRMLSTAFSMLRDKESKQDDRIHAGLVIADVAEQGDENVLKELHALHEAEDPNAEANVAMPIVNVLARLGDRRKFDEIAKPLRKQIKEAMAAPDGDPNVIIGASVAMARLHEGVNDYRDALANYANAIGIVLQIPPTDQNPRLRATVANWLYNMGCSASRLKDINLALWSVNEAFNFGGDTYDWAKTDGDLENLRADPRFAEMMTEWKEGKRKVNQPTEFAEFQKLMAPYRPTDEPDDKDEAAPAAPAKDDGGQ